MTGAKVDEANMAGGVQVSEPYPGGSAFWMVSLLMVRKKMWPLKCNDTGSKAADWQIKPGHSLSQAKN